MYSSKSHITGKRLGNYLGIPNGKVDDMRDVRYDYLIRYGASDGIHYIPEIRTINKKRALENNVNKLQSLKILDEAGVPVPDYSSDTNEFDYPFIGRSNNHMEGNDIQLILQEKDLEISNSDYYVNWIPKKKEYRCHIIDGNVVKISKKRLDEPNEYNSVMWNYENGFHFVNPDERPIGTAQSVAALEALELDFGAVDLMISEQNNPYILEVNTGVGLSEPSLEVYGEKLAEMVELNEYPGMETVDWEDE